MNKNFFVGLVLCGLFLTSCEKKQDDEKVATIPAITEGIYGTVVERYGDWMPGSPKGGGERPIMRSVFVYEYTKISDFESIYYSEFPMDKMPKTLVGIGRPGCNGFYEISLKPGIYSVFIEDKGKLCANGCDGYGGINPVVISADSIVLMNLVLDHAVY